MKQLLIAAAAAAVLSFNAAYAAPVCTQSTTLEPGGQCQVTLNVSNSLPLKFNKTYAGHSRVSVNYVVNSTAASHCGLVVKFPAKWFYGQFWADGAKYMTMAPPSLQLGVFSGTFYATPTPSTRSCTFLINYNESSS